jgi:iron-regulated transporter 1
MVTYLLSIGYNATQIGIVRTLSVILELGATWAAPMLMAKIGPIRSGIWFLNWQLLCLVGAGSFFYGANSTTISATGLIIGTMLSRVGLWGFDLSAQILVQNVSCLSQGIRVVQTYVC